MTDRARRCPPGPSRSARLPAPSTHHARLWFGFEMIRTRRPGALTDGGWLARSASDEPPGLIHPRFWVSFSRFSAAVASIRGWFGQLFAASACDLPCRPVAEATPSLANEDHRTSLPGSGVAAAWWRPSQHCETSQASPKRLDYVQPTVRGRLAKHASGVMTTWTQPNSDP